MKKCQHHIIDIDYVYYNFYKPIPDRLIRGYIYADCTGVKCVYYNGATGSCKLDVKMKEV